MLKNCLKCNIDRSLNDYHKDSSKKDGLHPFCKLCRKEIKRQHYLMNKDQVIEKTKQYASHNRERTNLNARKWRKNNPEKYKETLIRFRKKSKLNPLIRLKNSMRQRLSEVLNTKRWIKTSFLNMYLGCSPEEFRLHLEKQFKPNMTWDNYGIGKNKWTLDHIIPLSSAETEEELYKLCHYSNIQPMWYIDNIKKGNKFQWQTL